MEKFQTECMSAINATTLNVLILIIYSWELSEIICRIALKRGEPQIRVERKAAGHISEILK